ncbi:hypothetical protein [Absidia glauca]|uniref:Uncharacterized protein n=1 Tax=Absidia glauca TaxID=4829 RepID=A0A163KRW7_ABSGL|nr:hypothetical protein [Absidia glauca]
MSSQQAQVKQLISTVETMSKYMKKEFWYLKEQVALSNANIPPPSTDKAMIPRPRQTPNKAAILKTIEEDLLDDTMYAFTDLVLSKVRGKSELTPRGRKALALYEVLSVWSRNLVSEEHVLTGETSTFVKLPSIKKNALIKTWETTAVKYKIHISQTKNGKKKVNLVAGENEDDDDDNDDTDLDELDEELDEEHQDELDQFFINEENLSSDLDSLAEEGRYYTISYNIQYDHTNIESFLQAKRQRKDSSRYRTTSSPASPSLASPPASSSRSRAAAASGPASSSAASPGRGSRSRGRGSRGRASRPQ